jgi:hypothetical protein
MQKIKSYSIMFIALLLLTVTGCDSLFDTGDTEKVYDGPPQVAFFPLQREVGAGAGSTWVQVQLIATAARTSDLTINFSADGTSTATAGTHYNIPSSSVVLPAGQWTVNINVNLIAGSVPAGQERLLVLNLDGTNQGDVVIADNLKRSRIFIRG